MKKLIVFLFIMVSVITESKETRPQLRKQSSLDRVRDFLNATTSNKSSEDENNLEEQRIIRRLMWNPSYRKGDFEANKKAYIELFGKNNRLSSDEV